MANGNYALIDEHVKVFVNSRITELISSPAEQLVEFPPFLMKSHRNFARYLAEMQGLNCTTYKRNGIKTVKVYKKTCCTNFTKLVPTFCLTDAARKVIFHHLKNNTADVDEDEQYEANTKGKSKIPAYRLCSGTISKNVLIPPPKSQSHLADDIRSQMPIFQYKELIIDTVWQSRVTILCADSFGGQSTEVPQYILDECNKHSENCRIVYSLAHKISAVQNSQIVSNQRGERLGLTVGYQIQLESMSSMCTNLLYTTTIFFLRCLMGNTNRDVFSTITHIIVEDVSDRDMFGDMLLYEIREALSQYHHLKVIVMCSKNDVSDIQKYFNKGSIVGMRLAKDVTVYHLEDVMGLIAGQYRREPWPYNKPCHELADNILDRCMIYGNEKDFEEFFRMVREKVININAQHSVTRLNFAMTAARHNELEYLAMFSSLGGDLMSVDKLGKSVYTCAQESQSESSQEFSCNRYLPSAYKSLNSFISEDRSRDTETGKELHKNRDFGMLELVVSVIQYIQNSYSEGKILVLLSSLSEIARQDFRLKQSIAQGTIKSNTNIYWLHDNTPIEDYRKSFENDASDSYTVVLCSNLPVTVFTLKNIAFVIDSGRRMESSQATERPWISRNCAIRRALLPEAKDYRFCFRLYTESQFRALEKPTDLDVDKTELENFCLYAKLLSPHTQILDYLDNLKHEVPAKKVNESIQSLQEIGAVDETESVTALGIRLVDLPINAQLGKVVLFGIVLQCLDPVLTIVSMLAYRNPPAFLRSALNRKRIEQVLSKDLCAEDAASDHLLLLRLYQMWIQDSDSNDIQNEDEYVLNAEMESISNIRAQLIGILRASSLIQSNGMMSIHFMNQRASNWPLVKAAFAAGLYPNVCRVDRLNKDVKFKSLSKANFDERSIFKGRIVDTYQTDWMIYHAQDVIETNVNTVCNSLVSPVTLAIFTGQISITEQDAIPLSEEESDSEAETCETSKMPKFTEFNIDEWISFQLCTEDAYLLFELRRRFFDLFNDIIEVLDSGEKCRKNKVTLSKKFSIVETIGNLLQVEEQAYCFPLPKKVGDRPTAFSSKLVRHQEKIASLKSSMMATSHRNVINVQCENTDNKPNRLYFVLEVTSRELVASLYERRCWSDLSQELKNIIVKYRQFPTATIIVFILLRASEVFCGLGQVHFDGEYYFLNEIASHDVPLNSLIDFNLSDSENCPALISGEELDTQVGSRLFDMYLEQKSKDNS